MMPGAWSWPRPTSPAQTFRCLPLGHYGPLCAGSAGLGSSGGAGLQPHHPRPCSPSLGSPAGLGSRSETNLLTPCGSRRYRLTGATWKIKLRE